MSATRERQGTFLNLADTKPQILLDLIEQQERMHRAALVMAIARTIPKEIIVIISDLILFDNLDRRDPLNLEDPDKRIWAKLAASLYAELGEGFPIVLRDLRLLTEPENKWSRGVDLT